MPDIINQILEYLQETNEKLILSQNDSDGRINSVQNEKEILDLIAKKFKIERPRHRHWFDFAIYDENNNFYPVNIKVTTTKTNDNLSSKLGIYYALTGKIPDFNNEINWEEYFKNLKENIQESKEDYYFLIVNKKDIGDVFANSLKQLKILTPNGNNLPFQATWNRNRIPQKRNFGESKDFILQNFGKSIDLRANIYKNFKKHFGEYL
jgi:hypothetical protein